MGLDSWEPSLTLAHVKVMQAGLESRVALRALPIQAYQDLEGFDLVWFPSFLIPDAVIDDALGQVRRLLRPDGTVVIGVIEARTIRSPVPLLR